jgi:hypothetical protein
MVATRSSTRHFIKQVASDGAGGVGHIFGLVAGHFWAWAKKQSWSPLDALQI